MSKERWAQVFMVSRVLMWVMVLFAITDLFAYYDSRASSHLVNGGLALLVSVLTAWLGTVAKFKAGLVVVQQPKKRKKRR